MNAQELYAKEPLETLHDPSLLVGTYFNHLSGANFFQGCLPNDDPERLLELRILDAHTEDYRRGWRLATVWYDGRPVMVITNAGREGDDHAKRYVTDRVALMELTGHVARLAAEKSIRDAKQLEEETVGPTEDVPQMTRFYNWTAFDRDNDGGTATGWIRYGG